MIDIITNPEGMHYKVRYQQELTEWIYANRRRGAPKHTWVRTATEHLWEEIRAKDNTWRNIPLDIRRRDVKDRINSYAREEKERIEKERGTRKYPGGMNWGINQKLEDDTLKEREEREGWEVRSEREREGRVAGGNLRSNIRGTERDERTPIRDREGEGCEDAVGVGSSSSRWVFGGNLRSTHRDTV